MSDPSKPNFNILHFSNYQLALLVEAMYRQIESSFERAGGISRAIMVNNMRDGYALLFMDQNVAEEINEFLKTKPDCLKDSFAIPEPTKEQDT